MSTENANGLFRQQAIEHQKNRLAGSVLLLQPLSFSLLTIFLIALFITALIFLSFGEYTRKEVVSGYLVPNKGVLKVYAPQMAKVEAVHVSEGESVKAGQLLVTLVAERGLSSGQDSGAISLNELNQQREMLRREASAAKRLYQKQLASIKLTKKNSLKTLTKLEQQLATMERRDELYKEQLRDATELYTKGFLSKTEYASYQQQQLALQQELQQLKALVLQEKTELDRLQGQISRLPSELERQQSEYARQLSSLKQRALNEEFAHRQVIRATADGRVAHIHVKENEVKGGRSPIMTLLPNDSLLQAELWLPTRAAGFVEEGQSARIRFDAFPHQRFGLGAGTLASVSRSILLPGEVSLPLQFQEPVYRVLVDLEKQSISAYGKELPLQAGMMLKADLLLERRNLLDWLLDPLYSLRGRV